jgi:hypothetical protein
MRGLGVPGSWAVPAGQDFAHRRLIDIMCSIKQECFFPFQQIQTAIYSDAGFFLAWVICRPLLKKSKVMFVIFKKFEKYSRCSQ